MINVDYIVGLRYDGVLHCTARITFATLCYDRGLKLPRGEQVIQVVGRGGSWRLLVGNKKTSPVAWRQAGCSTPASIGAWAELGSGGAQRVLAQQIKTDPAAAADPASR
uniref:Uncharacterized protein n=1 Tax=Oryza punctata TaxID=4537 RepID=A0A0E0K7K9_ORYPU